MANTCKECGCQCKKCASSSDHLDVHLHVEIENLKQKLVERENHIVMMETNFLNEANKFPSGELVALREELLTWQDKYRRLYDAHRRVQRVNQGLEDKLLNLVDVCETDKSTLTKDVATLSHKLAEANYCVKKLTDDNERYKNDVSLAIQFLQCKQSNFVAHKFDSLPQEVQVQVSAFMTHKRSPEEKRVSYERKSIKVPIPTFPPTAMVYSIPKSPNPERRVPSDPESPSVDIVSAAIMAKVLEERQKEKAYAKHCDTCTCSRKLEIIHDVPHHTIGTQTGGSVCRCNESLQGNVQRMRLEAAPKIIPIYPNENIEANVAKVQPNNFLADPNKNKLGTRLDHHQLCKEKCESDAASAKNGSETHKGGRQCSLRVQTGTRNILLDNAQNSVAPVLYTRHHKANKREETVKTHIETSAATSSSEELKNVSIVTDNSTMNQQRVADWIQNNLDHENVGMSSSENSHSEPLLKNSAPKETVKYAEMEEHVKRFLFGESEFLKTVEIGRMKYQSFREGDEPESTNSHTQTKI